jgi:hypothetical protein
MAALVYLLCALTSLLCAGLLWRSYRKVRTGLLFWSALCFIGLAANNILLVVDMMVVEQIDLSLLRTVVSLVSMVVMLGSLIWEMV